MSGISMDRLKQLAGTNIELRLKDGEIEESEGSLGGRMMRNLKIKLSDDDRTVERDEYVGAKDHVLMAMIEHYGEDIGTRAFRAGVGHLTSDGRYETSLDHPISGRHIEKMLEVAEKEFGPRVMSEWMDKYLGREGQSGARQIEMGGEAGISQSAFGFLLPVEPDDPFERMVYRFKASTDARFGERNPPSQDTAPENHSFHVLKIQIDGESMTLGLHQSIHDRDTVDVLAFNGETATVAVDELEEWLKSRFDSEELKGITLHNVRDKGIVDDKVSRRDITLDHRATTDGDDLGVRRDFDPDRLEFTPSGGIERASLRQVFTDDRLSRFANDYRSLFDEDELEATQRADYLSGPLRQSVLGRTDIRTGTRKLLEDISRNFLDTAYERHSRDEDGDPDRLPPDPSAEQRRRAKDREHRIRAGVEDDHRTVRKALNERLAVRFPTKTDGRWELDRDERKLLSRFMNPAPFIELYNRTAEVLGRPSENEPTISIDAMAQQGPNGEILIGLRFSATLPQDDDAPDLELNMQVVVPLSELGSGAPKVTLPAPYLTQR